jgi:peroxiredoxin Q/BCP
LSELRDSYGEFAARNAVVYGVNPASIESHARFAAKLELPFPLLSDRGGLVAWAYKSGLWRIVRRTVYVIGPDGRILLARRGAPAPRELLAVLPPSR